MTNAPVTIVMMTKVTGAFVMSGNSRIRGCRSGRDAAAPHGGERSFSLPAYAIVMSLLLETFMKSRSETTVKTMRIVDSAAAMP